MPNVNGPLAASVIRLMKALEAGGLVGLSAVGETIDAAAAMATTLGFVHPPIFAWEGISGADANGPHGTIHKNLTFSTLTGEQIDIPVRKVHRGKTLPEFRIVDE